MLEDKRITVDSLPVQYYAAGENNPRTLLLLHGDVGDAPLHWTPAADGLADSYRIVAPNLPGYGASAQTPEPTLAALVGWLKALLDALEIEQTAVVGNSFGGLAARLFAAAYPQRVPAVILVNGGALPQPMPPLARALAGLPVIGKRLAEAASRTSFTAKGLSWMVANPALLTDAFLERAKANAPGLSWTQQVMSSSPIPEKRVPPLPTLLLWGADDPVLTQQDAARLQAELPGAQLALIERTRHAPHIDEPDVFAFRVTRFLDNLDRSSQPRLPGVGKLGRG